MVPPRWSDVPAELQMENLKLSSSRGCLSGLHKTILDDIRARND